MITKEQYARFDDICHKLYERSSETGMKVRYLTQFNESRDIFVEVSCLITATGTAMYTLVMSYRQPGMNPINLFETWFGSYEYDEDFGSINLCDDSLEICVMTLYTL